MTDEKLIWNRALAILTPREMEVLILYGVSEMTQSQVGRHIGISPARVKQLKCSIEQKLRATLKTQKLAA